MTATIHLHRATCQADPLCDRPLRFQADLEGRIGWHRVAESEQACAVHLGNAAQHLADWARTHQVTSGQVTVFAIDPPQPQWPSPALQHHEFIPGCLEFGSIPVGT